MDIVEEAIAYGANPFKCEKRGLPFVVALRTVEGRYGRERLNTYLTTIRQRKVFGTASAGKLVRTGIAFEFADLILMGLEIGHPIDAPMNVDYQIGRFPDPFRGKTPLYVASVMFLSQPTRQREQIVRILVDSGASMDPEIPAYVSGKFLGPMRGAVTTLDEILALIGTGSN